MSTSARARVHDELVREIKRAARRQLAEHGPAGLSLRAVARELGMASSAMYRYFPSRAELLTALIVDAHDALGSAVESAESAVRRRNLLGRWLAMATATRAWALSQPQQYALVYGGPARGHRLPAGPHDPAARLPSLLARIVADASLAGHGPAADGRQIPRALRADLRASRDSMAPALTEFQLAQVVLAWTELVGSVSFEIFGQLRVVNDCQSHFDYQMRGVGRRLGLSAERPGRAQSAAG
ncbi:MAG: TetR/AcrR family transcriptional regulator [Jatrophihabitantaceae bacterium]